jgi:hypothetical protein
MVNIIVFDLLFLDVYPALANAIIVFLLLLTILYFNKEVMSEAYQKLTSSSKNFSVPLKRRLITFGITVLIIALIFTFDSLIEHWLGASKQKIIE